MAHGCREPTLPAGGGGGSGPLSRRRHPAQLPGLVDSHCHLQHQRFDHDRQAVMERAAAAGIERILVPGWDLPSSEAALELAARHAPLVQAAVGVHPHHAAAIDAAAWARIETLAAERGCVAVGEIGLDLFRNLSPPEVQRDALARQLALAARLARPVLIHDRDAHTEISAALLAWAGLGGRPARGVLHAFSGDGPMAASLAAAGFLVSFALPVSFRSAVGPRAAAGALAAGSFLVETDSPYLGPDPAGRNEPASAVRVASEVARIRGESPEAVARAVRDAYERLIVG